MARPFLTTDWTDVVLVNYRVPPDLLWPHVPPGSELDTPDGQPELHLLSLVALNFSNTRVRGIPLLTARHFPEVNLRFYVRRSPLRATVFLREYVPAPLVIGGARLFYNQPYHHARIVHSVTRQEESITVQTTFQHREYRGAIHLRARNTPMILPAESQAHFLKEHYWGFDRTRDGRSFRYQVDHPIWRTYPIDQVEVTINPGALLGGAWREIDWDDHQHSVLFAEGSHATIYGPEPLIGDEPPTPAAVSADGVPTADRGG